MVQGTNELWQAIPANRRTQSCSSTAELKLVLGHPMQCQELPALVVSQINGNCYMIPGLLPTIEPEELCTLRRLWRNREEFFF
jgi:hypothetical protein